MKRMKYLIETRLTYDHGGGVGVHCNYPLGLYNNTESNGSCEIDRGRLPIRLQMDWQDGWALITEVSGQPMTKILQPTETSKDYHTYDFFFYGKLYHLELRIDWMEEV